MPNPPEVASLKTARHHLPSFECGRRSPDARGIISALKPILQASRSEMMRKLSGQIVAAAVVLAVATATPIASRAQTYKAGDIVKHFEPAMPPVSATRSLVCVGTETDCSRAGRANPIAVAAFDLVVRFKYNSDVLEPDARVNLDEFAKALKSPQLSVAKFVVEGHTDAAGSPDYNLSLSERRAASVVRYLRENGVAASKLLARGYGQSRPVAADPFSGDNRRVETRLSVE